MPPIILGTYEPYSVGELRREQLILDPTQHTYLVGASGALIMASATPFCFCTTQKYLAVKRVRSSMT